MNDWIEKPEQLRDVESVKAMLGERVKGNKEYHTPRIKLLDEFFEEHQSPVDIAVILNGGLASTYLLANYIERNNLLFFRPKTSKLKRIDESSLVGELHPERTLLLFDADMEKGTTMKECDEYFTRNGYQHEKIFGYLNFGSRTREYGIPELMHIDILRNS